MSREYRVRSLWIAMLLCTVVVPSARAADAPVTVSVCGAVRRNETGLQVRPGEVWRIEVIGATAACADGRYGSSELSDCNGADCKWKDGRFVRDATGWETWWAKPFAFLKRVRGAQWYELVGAVGNDERQTFVVGRSNDVPIAAEGELILFANDACALYRNNRGALTVRITRISR